MRVERRQQVDAETHHHGTDDHEGFDPLDPGYYLACDDPHCRHREDERGEHRTRPRRGLPEDALHEERSVEYDTEHPDPDHEHKQRGRSEDPALEQREWYHGLGRPELYGDESGEQDSGDDESCDNAGGVPVVPFADPREREQETTEAVMVAAPR